MKTKQALTFIPNKPLRRFPLKPHHLLDPITPAKDVFVVSPLGPPLVDMECWRLTIDGMVDHPITLTFDELLRMPKRQCEAFHQCAGNPLQWQHPTRRITNLIWGGVDLAELLSRTGVHASARFLWSYGLDHGEYLDTQVDAYVKDLPLHEVAARGALLAYEVNGEPLLPEHGYPLRLIVPGFYGTNSVKWLNRLELTDKRSTGLFTTKLYNDPTPPTEAEPNGGTKPVWEVAPESIIVSPLPNSYVLPSAPLEIWGWAWSKNDMAAVKVSTDNGATWQIAQLAQRREQSWQRFSLRWQPDRWEGETKLLSCATDCEGQSQPPNGTRNAVYAVPIRFGIQPDSTEADLPKAE